MDIRRGNAAKRPNNGGSDNNSRSDSNNSSGNSTNNTNSKETQNKSGGVLTTDKETQKLFTVLCNYLSLAQFELARSVLDELFHYSPERVAHVLRALVLADIPSSW